jgi:hypothetical protein
MSRWYIILAVASSLAGCAGEQEADEGALETLPQIIDAGTSVPTSDAGDASVATEIGQACVADGDCKAAGAKCQKSVSVPFVGLSINYPGGYCTFQCKADAACGAGAGCPMSGSAILMPALSTCLKRCEIASDCREGYSCAAVPALTLPGLGAAPAPTGPAPKHCLPPLPGAAPAPK